MVGWSRGVVGRSRGMVGWGIIGRRRIIRGFITRFITWFRGRGIVVIMVMSVFYFLFRSVI